MEKSIIHRSELFILTTIDIINEFGIQGVSTREIAKRQGVSEATLFRYYASKNDLLLAVVEYFSKYDSDLFISTRIKGLSPLEAINYYSEINSIYYENYPAITALEQSYETILREPYLAEKMKEILNNRLNFIKENLDAAKLLGNTRDFDSDLMADMITGSIRAICLRWRVENYSFPLSEEIKKALKTILYIIQ